LNGRNTELVDELVRLSKEYGILTPYTAFLAREDVDLNAMSLNAMSQNQRIANEELKELEVVRGESANDQRAYKSTMQNNTKVQNSAPVQGGAYKKDEQAEKNMANVRNVGSKTFYNKNNQWVDGSLDAKTAKNVVKVRMYSDEYFKLAKGQSAEFNQYLSVGENVVVVINNVAYEFYK